MWPVRSKALIRRGTSDKEMQDAAEGHVFRSWRRLSGAKMDTVREDKRCFKKTLAAISCSAFLRVKSKKRKRKESFG